MRFVFLSIAAAFLIGILFPSSNAFAATSLEERLELLEERVEKQEKENKELKKELEKYKKEAKNAPSPEEEKEDKTMDYVAPLKKFFETTRVDLAGNMSYSYNFNDPALRTNQLRIFDTSSNGFRFHLVEIAIESRPLDWLGFRVDLDFGQDPILFEMAGFAADEFALQQAYIDVTAPLGHGITFKGGIFVTLLGAEVIESWDNWNTSRSFLFGFAIPFRHLGLLVSYPFFDWLQASVGVVQGWDNVVDNNDGKSVIGQVAYNHPSGKFSLIVSGIIGPEQPDSFFTVPSPLFGIAPPPVVVLPTNGDENLRGVLDVIAILKPIDNLTLMLNYDFGKEEGIGGNGIANWWGIAGYGHYRFNRWVGFSTRGEFFDDDGSRTGTHQKLWEVTATGHLYITDHLEIRAEYRHDDSNVPVFLKGFRPVETQDTISGELIFKL